MSSPPRSYRSSRRSRSLSRSPRRFSHRSRSPRRSSQRSRSPYERHKNSSSQRRPLPTQKQQWGREEDNKHKEEEPVEKEMPNFGLSGKLASETNTVKGVELKYNEPPESAKPTQKWRLQSSYLVGRDRAVTDIPIDHPSCSKQHAVIQYREVDEKDTIGRRKKVIKPFVIDLDATNGTFLNGNQIPSTRFVELKATDVLKFGTSTRDYVLLHAD